MVLEYRIPVKYLFGIIKYDLIIVALVIAFTHFVAQRFGTAFPDMPLAVPAFLGTSISVLLSFKMNQSYDRWWEARKLWGAIANDSASFIIQLQSLVEYSHGALIKPIACRQMAWCYVLGRSLRNLPVLGALDHLLSKEELADVSKCSNPSLFVLNLNAQALKELRLHKALDVHAHIRLLETMSRLTDSMGGTERIKRTIFPSTYRLVLHFIIYLFVTTLAISLKDINHILVSPLLLLISIGFFLIERIAYHLQDPFNNLPSDVPVTSIAVNIEKNIWQLLGEPAVTNEHADFKYYVM